MCTAKAVGLDGEPKKAAKSSIAFLPFDKQKSHPVAIVGMGAHFGPWDTLQKFQQRVLGGDDQAEPTAPEHWWGTDESHWLRELASSHNRFRGYYVPQVGTAPGKFRIPPTELKEMLPRQLLMLDVAEQALTDAGLKNEELLFTGVYVGTGLDLNATNFSFRWGCDWTAMVHAAWSQRC